MLLLAYLLTLNPEWNRSLITIRSIVSNEKARSRMAESLSNMIADVRIRAKTEVIVRTDGQSVQEIIHSYSGSADVVFLGMMNPDEGSEAEAAKQMIQLSGGLKTTIFVLHSSEFSGKLI